MSKNLILLIIFFIIFNGFTLYSEQFIANYYSNVNKAELLIIQAKYKEAVKHYKKAEKYRNLFAKDAFNACLASVQINNFGATAHFAENLLKKGVDSSFFKMNFEFENFVKSKDWQLLTRKRIQCEIDFNIRNYILNLLEKDQNPRLNNLDILERVKVDLEIGKIMDSLFLKYGYLNEELIGIFPEKPDEFPRGWSPLDIILIHQVKLDKSKFKSLFEKYVHHGKMHNTKLAMHSTNFDNDSFYLFRCFNFGMGDFIKIGQDVFTCGDDLEKLINNNRQRIHLPNLAFSIISADFRKRNTKFILGAKPMFYTDLDFKQQDDLRADLLSKGYRLIKE
ncbi:MAG: hypothetical protein KA270_11930 [Saprospiraceae bacterium]|nr:hypothetical protein [Saprospiraceae bacterium]MBP6567870.1 hypothetical protein [Saprospiraceae bacterium]